MYSQVDDHYEEDFNQLSLEDDSDENHGRQGRRHYPPTKANQVKYRTRTSHQFAVCKKNSLMCASQNVRMFLRCSLLLFDLHVISFRILDNRVQLCATQTVVPLLY